MIIIIILRPR